MSRPLSTVARPLPGVVYPPEEVLVRYLEEGALTRETLVDAMVAAFENNPNGMALCTASRECTFAELHESSDRLAAALLDLGLEPQDRALFQLDNGIELAVAYAACLKAGVIPVCTILPHREREIGELGRQSGARAHFVLGEGKADLVAFALAMKSEIPTMRYVVVCRGVAPAGTHSMASLIEAQGYAAARTAVRRIAHDPFQVAVFQLSGGTTSVPKIIPRFHNEYLYNWRAVASHLGYGEGEVLFTPAPLIHNAGTIMVFGPGLLGATVLLAPPDRDSIFALLRKYAPTRLLLPRPVILRLKVDPERASLDLSRLRSVVSTNSAQLTEEALGVPGVHVFGMTEGVIMFTQPQDSPAVRHGTMGRPISRWDEVRLLAPGAEREVAEGEVGELCIKGPYTMHGYFDAADRNAQVFTSDGFYRSGDLMSVQCAGADRVYRFEGRIKDVVDRAGEKINCEEVEQAIRCHPAVVEVALVGMPDPQYGERPCAYIIPIPGRTVPSVAELGEFLKRAGLAKYKWPERIEQVPQLPSTKLGKIDKLALRKDIGAKLAAGSA